MLTLNFQTFNFAAELGMLNCGILKIYVELFSVDYLILKFLTLKNKPEYDLLSYIQRQKNPDTLFQCINIHCLEFNGFLFSKSYGTDLLP
jgi:hypothetical protein